MQRVLYGSVFVAVCSVWCGSTALASEERPPIKQPLAPSTEAAQEGGKYGSGTLTLTPVPNGGGVVQGQGTITVTATAQAMPVGGIAGNASIDANGVREFQNEEYGKKIKIIDDPKNGIKIEYTTKKGADETKKYDAKDVAELEKKHPEAFKLYQQYMGNQAAMAGAGPVILQAMPVGPGQPVPFPMPGGGAQQGILQVLGPGVLQAQGQAVMVGGGDGVMPIEAATDLMGQLSKDIQSAAKNGSWKDASKESKAAIKKQAEELKKQLADLEKQFGEK